MNSKSVPPPVPEDLAPQDLAPQDLAPEDLATERLIAAVESAIAGIQERLANLAAGDHDAKWSVSDLVRLLQLRNQLQGERPRRIFAYWLDAPPGIENHNGNEDGRPGPDTPVVTCIDDPDLPRNHRNRNKEARK